MNDKRRRRRRRGRLSILFLKYREEKKLFPEINDIIITVFIFIFCYAVL